MKRVRLQLSIKRILPSTDLKEIIPESAGFVINTADEPYIGHISIKLGRYLWGKGISMYVAGGFDAHLMSTGDFFVPGESVCVDCCSGHFTSALKIEAKLQSPRVPSAEESSYWRSWGCPAHVFI